MFSVGSVVSSGGVDCADAKRSSPTCCQQKPFRLFAADGLKPVHGVPAAGCFTPFTTKI